MSGISIYDNELAPRRGLLPAQAGRSGGPAAQNPIYYPADDDFPAEDVERFLRFIAGFVEGFSKSLSAWWKDRFLLAVQSNLILYGFDGEQFFTRGFDSEEEFQRERTTLAECLPTPVFYNGNPRS